MLALWLQCGALFHLRYTNYWTVTILLAESYVRSCSMSWTVNTNLIIIGIILNIVQLAMFNLILKCFNAIERCCHFDYILSTNLFFAHIFNLDQYFSNAIHSTKDLAVDSLFLTSILDRSLPPTQ